MRTQNDQSMGNYQNPSTTAAPYKVTNFNYMKTDAPNIVEETTKEDPNVVTDFSSVKKSNTTESMSTESSEKLTENEEQTILTREEKLKLAQEMLDIIMKHIKKIETPST